MSERTRVEVAAFSLPRAGGTNEENEDSYRVAGENGGDPWADFAGIVADGVGTSREPAAASRAAAESWLQFLSGRLTERPDDLSRFDAGQFRHLIRECFAQAHLQVRKSASGG